MNDVVVGVARNSIPRLAFPCQWIMYQCLPLSAKVPYLAVLLWKDLMRISNNFGGDYGACIYDTVTISQRPWSVYRVAFRSWVDYATQETRAICWDHWHYRISNALECVGAHKVSEARRHSTTFDDFDAL